MIRSLWFTVIVVCSSAVAICNPLPLPTVIFSRPLPVGYVNVQGVDQSGAPNPRSNFAFTETGGADPLLQTAFDGDDFKLDATKNNSYLVTSLSTWSVASTLGQPLGDEFQNVSLYIRPVAIDPISGAQTPESNWQIVATGTPNTSFADSNNTVVGNSNPNITHTNVKYTPAVNPRDYEADGSPGLLFPLWKTSFSNLNLLLPAGKIFQFAVWGTGWYNNDVPCGDQPDFQCMDPTSSYGFWFSEYSSPFLSGNRQNGADGLYQKYVNFLDPSICPTPDSCGLSASTLVQGFRWDGSTVPVDENVIIEGIALPEPASFVLAGLGLIIVGCLYRKRRK